MRPLLPALRQTPPADEVTSTTTDGIITITAIDRVIAIATVDRVIAGAGPDIIITATGLKLQLFGAAQITVDGEPIKASEHMVYKGTMLDGVPNCAISLGYTNMSWTLKCDLISRYLCRLLNFMEENNFTVCSPVLNDSEIQKEELIDFNSGYFQRSAHILPKQGNKSPWKLHQSYLHDILQTNFARLDDGTLKFSR